MLFVPLNKHKKINMQKIILSLCTALLLISTGMHAQNLVYDANAEVRKVDAFTKVHVSGAISLYLSQGKEQAVAISASDDKYIPKIKTEVSNGTLKIYVENGAWNGWNWGNKKLKAYVTVTQLEGLDVSGASAAIITDPITVGNLKVQLTGASTLEGNIKAGSLGFDVSGASTANIEFTATGNVDVQATGASTVRGEISGGNMSFDLSGASGASVKGTTDELKIQATGASNFHGYDLMSTSCRVEATGASDVNISVSKTLDAHASGASSIDYKGEAVITSLDVSGASSVKKKS